VVANPYTWHVVNHYEILGLVRSADEAAIRKAHRSLARKYHPDLNPAADATERFSKVQQAYETLIDPKSRAAYDQRLLQREAGYASEAAAVRGGTYAWSNIASPTGRTQARRSTGSATASAAAAGAAKAAAELREEELDEEAAEIWRVWFAGRRRG
jgi:curved DNA-binding protein CbpA